ncbi:transcriptional regulator with XRE-family HTH domain [Kitasatospora sp. MAA4]|uniref:helix-turn-helix domain-containing protein n=1 Tax=Kitasatospora sp. MAA4 TaxID=3035093 RepID=UPI002475B33B|nr:helix-turn-helix transcriptional regulator [Kitasatospora sp. MAA4]MDH6136151.1 transcriptional regulator with XRE-family HTH domain [Kitasatospora sp. MAA4]
MAGRKNTLDPSESPGSLFGGMLRHYRELRDMSQPQLAAKVPCDASFISKVESGTRPPKDDLAERCDVILRTGGALTYLMPYVKKRLELVFPEGFMDYVAEEARATELRTFETTYVPGLLQTPAYASALLGSSSANLTDTPDTVEERLALRLDRQQILTAETPPFLFAVIDESALRRPIGGPAVMREQLDQLLTAAERPSIALQVAPLALGERTALTSSLIILTLPDGSTVGYSETMGRGVLERDPMLVASRQRLFTLLQIAALSQDASMDLIRSIRQELYS